ncbi:MAG: CPBP family intramembrane metalloprotease [Nitriliruptoraceae bacterium]|nr:CPBP family intramembrane metalloprotease [Nitriliruptoraceae bacterium]
MNEPQPPSGDRPSSPPPDVPPPGAPAGPPPAPMPATGPMPAAGAVDTPTMDPRAGFPRVRHRVTLDAVRSPYGLIVAVSTILIFSAPNLLTVLVFALADGLSLDDVVGGDGGGITVGALVATLILQLGVLALALLPLLAAGRPYSRVLGPTRWTPVMWLLGLAIGFGTAVVTYTINFIVVLLAGVDEPVEQGLTEVVTAGGALTWLAILLAVVVAPVGEELLFRGVLHRAIADKAGFVVGAIVSSVLFAVVHIEVVFSQPYGLVGLFVVGFLLALAYHLTGSLIVPILGHAVYNGISVGLVFLADQIDLEMLDAVSWLPSLLGLWIG